MYNIALIVVRIHPIPFRRSFLIPLVDCAVGVFSTDLTGLTCGGIREYLSSAPAMISVSEVLLRICCFPPMSLLTLARSLVLP